MEYRKKRTAPENMIYGIKPLEEAFIADKEIDKIFVQRDLRSDDIVALLKQAAERNVPIAKVPAEKLERLTRKNHQGIIAFTASVSYASLDFVMSQVYERGENPLILVLDRVTDVRNFGAIARSAECMGVHAVVIPQRDSAPIGPDAVKTSAGALSHIPVCRERNLRNTIKYLKEYGLSVFGCTEKASELIYSGEFKSPTAIVMGSEEDGISDDLMTIIDHLVKIPMLGKLSSLNVSVATGMILSEVARQRGE